MPLIKVGLKVKEGRRGPIKVKTKEINGYNKKA